jgi:SAM-dependent methyltransferase
MPDLGAIRSTYEGWLAEHGAESALAAGWTDPAWQTMRFDVLAQVMEGEEPVSVADFGCASGALFEHLAARREPPPLGAYVGYDIVPAFVAAARAAHADPRVRFEVGSEVGEDVDYVLASGALTVRPGIGDGEWEEHVRGQLARLWARSRRGMAFNLLTRTDTPREEGFYAGDPETWARWCSRGLPGARVAVLAGPPLPDFSVLVRRNTPARPRGGGGSTASSVSVASTIF